MHWPAVRFTLAYMQHGHINPDATPGDSSQDRANTTEPAPPAPAVPPAPSAATAPATPPAPSAALLPPISPLRAAVESILLVVDTPVSIPELARALDTPASEVRECLQELEHEYRTRGSGIEVRETEEGWRLYTAPAHAPAVERFLLDGSQSKLSRAAMETLAVIAYRQPATRAQVSAVRGVNVDGVMRTLVARGLIAEAGEDPGTGAHLYVTTALFLELLGIDSLDQLPDLAPLLPEVDLIDEPL